MKERLRTAVAKGEGVGVMSLLLGGRDGTKGSVLRWNGLSEVFGRSLNEDLALEEPRSTSRSWRSPTRARASAAVANSR